MVSRLEFWAVEAGDESNTLVYANVETSSLKQSTRLKTKPMIYANVSIVEMKCVNHIYSLNESGQ